MFDTSIVNFYSFEFRVYGQIEHRISVITRTNVARLFDVSHRICGRVFSYFSPSDRRPDVFEFFYFSKCYNCSTFSTFSFFFFEIICFRHVINVRCFRFSIFRNALKFQKNEMLENSENIEFFKIVEMFEMLETSKFPKL